MSTPRKSERRERHPKVLEGNSKAPSTDETVEKLQAKDSLVTDYMLRVEVAEAFVNHKYRIIRLLKEFKS